MPAQTTNERGEPQAEQLPKKAVSSNGTSKISAVIKGKDAKFRPWSETAAVTSLSGSGAGFFLSRQCIVGRLISLILPMPIHLRRYDYDKQLYRTWGLVQYCYKAGGDEEAGYHVGVALIGQEAPESYHANP